MASSSSSAAAPPPPPPSWVILAVIAQVSDPGVAADVSVALAAPPRVTALTVHPRVAPEPTTPAWWKCYPIVLAADRSGLLLLNVVQGLTVGGPLIHDAPGRSLLLHRELVEGYFICDTRAGTAFHLPDLDPDHVGPIMHPGNIGLITAAAGDGYMVAELQPIFGSDRATLLCFSSDTAKWTEKRLYYPLSPRPWVPSGVLSNDGELWWIDITWGILNCNPFADEPELRFFPLPEDTGLPFQPAGADELERCRCVKVSAGKLRFVEMTVGYNPFRPPTFTMWTLSPTDPVQPWTTEYTVGLTTIWDSETYTATGLEARLPSLAALHPTNPDVAYFFLDAHIFGVDMRAARVVECDFHQVAQPPSDHLSSGFVHAWEPAPPRA